MIFGSKSEKDMKEIAPIVSKIKEVYPSLASLTNDELRARTQALRDKIQAAIKEDLDQIAALKAEAEAPECSLETKEANYKKVDELEKKVDDKVEQMPSFPGGMKAMMDYLARNIRYPANAKNDLIQGRVILQFIVDKKGRLSDVKVARSVEPSLDAEAVRVVKSMPRWNPGMQNGKAVKVRYTLPVTFRLQ